MKTLTFAVLSFLLLGFAANASDYPADTAYMDRLHAGLISGDAEAVKPASPSTGLDDLDWTALPDAPVTICRAGIGKIGDYIYIFGGQGTGGGSTALAFNIVTELWEYSTAPPVTGSNWSSTVANGALYLFPRSFGGGEVQKFTPDPIGPGGSWSLVAIYPDNTSGFAVGWDGGNYIYCAGNSSSPYSGESYRMDLTSNSFETLPDLPEGRGWVGGEFVNGKFYVMGGDNASYQYTNTCFEYDPATNTWATKSPLINATAFSCFNIATDGNLIYLVGGGGGNAASIPSTDTVQVYDPALDVWTLETERMNDYGTNAACYVAEGNYIFDAGGRDLSTTYVCTWKGPIVTGITDLVLTLTPHDPPIQIPASGGSFLYDISLENTTTDPIEADVWIEAVLPNSIIVPILTRLDITFPAAMTISRSDLQQVIPPNAPSGNYLYIARVGEVFGPVIDSDEFTFEKLAGDGSGGNVSEWILHGWDELRSAAYIPAEIGIQAIHPNPFNPTTRFTFTLTEVTEVNLSVYDISGRLVTTLVNGWRDAGTQEVTFDGSGLVSGVYIYRLNASQFSASGKMVLMK
jgi:hypothetical protein